MLQRTASMEHFDEQRKRHIIKILGQVRTSVWQAAAGIPLPPPQVWYLPSAPSAPYPHLTN